MIYFESLELQSADDVKKRLYDLFFQWEESLPERKDSLPLLKSLTLADFLKDKLERIKRNKLK